MKRALFVAVVLLCLAVPVTAAPTCYNCQGGTCWSSIMFQYKNCASSSTGACDAFDDCPYWLASRLDANGAAVTVSCASQPPWDLISSESFSGLQQNDKPVEWQVTAVTVQPAAGNAG